MSTATMSAPSWAIRMAWARPCPRAAPGSRSLTAELHGGCGKAERRAVVRRHLGQVAVGSDLYVGVDLFRGERRSPDAGEAGQPRAPVFQRSRQEGRLELGDAGLRVLRPHRHVGEPLISGQL